MHSNTVARASNEHASRFVASTTAASDPIASNAVAQSAERQCTRQCQVRIDSAKDNDPEHGRTFTASTMQAATPEIERTCEAQSTRMRFSAHHNHNASGCSHCSVLATTSLNTHFLDRLPYKRRSAPTSVSNWVAQIAPLQKTSLRHRSNQRSTFSAAASLIFQVFYL